MTENRRERPVGVEIIRLTLKNWLFIAVALAVTAICCFIFTSPGFVKPTYAAEAVIYPSAESTSSGLIKSDISFGSDKDVDNAMQVLQSTILKNVIVDKYDLIERYEIDTAEGRWLYDLNEQYADNIQIERTRYNSIVVKVYDEDPKVAAAMANDVVLLGDSVKAEILKKNLRNTYNTVLKELRLKTAEINALADSINHLKRRNYEQALAMRNRHFKSKRNTVNKLRSSIDQVRNSEGVYDIDKQYNSLYTTYLDAYSQYIGDSGKVTVMSRYLPEDDTALVRRKASLEGAKMVMKDTKTRLNKLNESGERFNELMDNYNIEKSVLSDIQGDYEFSLSTFDKEYDNLFLVTLKSKYHSELELLNQIKTKHDMALNNLADFVPASYVVSPAEAIHHKVAPRRSFIAVLITVSVYFLIILSLLGREYYSSIAASIKD